MSANYEISGKTLKTYLYLFQHGHCELREIQRGLGFSSPSLVSYHLGKLMEIGYVQQDEYGRYFVAKESPDKILAGYSRIGPKVVPQLFFFALLFSIVAAFFSVGVLFEPSYIPYLVAVCAAIIIVLWFETFRLWRRLSV